MEIFVSILPTLKVDTGGLPLLFGTHSSYQFGSLLSQSRCPANAPNRTWTSEPRPPQGETPRQMSDRAMRFLKPKVNALSVIPVCDHNRSTPALSLALTAAQKRPSMEFSVSLTDFRRLLENCAVE